MFMNSTRDTNIVCLRYNGDPATTLPCGYGPNNIDSTNVQLYSLSDNALIGATQLQASVYSLDSSSLLKPAGALRQRRSRRRAATRATPARPDTS